MTVGFYLVGADVLGDAADFPLGYFGVLDGIQQRGLAMVYVTKDGDHRRADHQLGFVFRAGPFRSRALGSGGRLGHAGADSQCSAHQSGHLIVDHLVHGRHDPVAHQLLDHINGILVQDLSQILDCHRLRQD